jgi:hypothetical protein
MAAEPESIMLLRRVEQKLGVLVSATMSLTVRITALEVQVASTNSRIDAICADLDRIERRLDGTLRERKET